MVMDREDTTSTTMVLERTEHPNNRVRVYKHNIAIPGNYMISGTEFGTWEEIWYVSNAISKHMSPNKDLFFKMKSRFSVEKHKPTSSLIFTYGTGGIDLVTKNKIYVIPHVSYVPEINENLLSLQQLILQGFEVEINGSCCTITHTLDTEKDEEDDETKEKLHESQPDPSNDQIEINGKQVSLKVDTIEGFISFMKMVNTNKIAYKNKELFARKFNDMLIWFHKEKAEKDFEGELPPRLSKLEICLFDLYKLVTSCGGYGKVSREDKWMEIALGFGFPACYDEDFKKIFEDYLLHPQTYYEFAIEVEIRYTYTEGLGTFEDQADGLADHFQATTVAATCMDVTGETNGYTEGLGTLDQASGFAGRFHVTVEGMEAATEQNKHVPINISLKEVKKEDDDFIII